MLTGQSNFSSVTSHFWPVRIFMQKSSTCNVSQIRPTNIVCLFQSLLDHLKIGLIFFRTDLTPVTRMALLSILNAWQTASEWSLAVRTDTCMHWCMFSLEVIIKKRFKTLRFTVGDLIVYSRMNNVTVSTWHDWSTWPVSGFWPVKSPFWPDIARWPAIILSPEYSSIKQIIHLHL